jgi:hypothetical protein
MLVVCGLVECLQGDNGAAAERGDEGEAVAQLAVMLEIGEVAAGSEKLGDPLKDCCRGLGHVLVPLRRRRAVSMRGKCGNAIVLAVS